MYSTCRPPVEKHWPTGLKNVTAHKTMIPKYIEI
jgi:hypothetical protein